VPLVVLNNLYKRTPLQSTFPVNMLALVEGRPRVLSLRELLVHFLRHRREVILRRSRYELEGAERRAHILEGLLRALDRLDEVIDTIRSSPDPATASQRLQQNFELSAEQARAILEMRLQRLTGLEREAVHQEYRTLLQTIERLRAILNSEQLQRQLIAEELRELERKYGDDRRTRIVYEAQEFTPEDIIPDEELIITLTHQGFIKRTPADAYRRQAKGGRGLSGAAPLEDDYVEHVLYATAHSDVLFFSDRGRCYRLKVYDIPEGARTARGRSLANLIAKAPEERITASLVVRHWDRADYIVLVRRSAHSPRALACEPNCQGTGGAYHRQFGRAPLGPRRLHRAGDRARHGQARCSGGVPLGAQFGHHRDGISRRRPPGSCPPDRWELPAGAGD